MVIPSFRQFLRWSGRYAVLPVSVSFPFKQPDFYPAFRALGFQGDGSFFLDSYRGGETARYSWFPLSGPEKRFRAGSLGTLKKTWGDFQKYLKENPGPTLSGDVPPFYGGAAGILSYDCRRIFERGWKTPPPPDRLGFPILDMGIYRELACLDHLRGRATLFTCLSSRKTKNRNLEDVYAQTLKRLIETGLRFQSLEAQVRSGSVPALRSPLTAGSRGHYLKAVARIKKYIAAGDIYQANFSQRMTAGFRGDPLDYFERLRAINPSPYALYFRCGRDSLVSCSPELLLKKRSRTLETRPIAGTRPRGKTGASDRELEGELLLSPKERAEHVMLLDLERNDLGRVCEPGSVRVTEKMVVERYSHVMHIVSHVQGKMRGNETVFRALEALFPGGTITGCPKVRCMEILDGLEPVSRGPFYGSCGWIGFQGDAEINLLIRTALVQGRRKKIILQTGSGIVADSVPGREYAECLHKARALVQALAP